MDKKTQYWIDLADYDIETAKAMLETKRYLYVGFMCHQSIEKALKAVITSQSGNIAPKIHNLIKISEMAGLFDSMNEQHKQTVFLLNPLNIESRYPSYKDMMLEQLTDTRCNEILSESKELLLWIKQQL